MKDRGAHDCEMNAIVVVWVVTLCSQVATIVSEEPAAFIYLKRPENLKYHEVFLEFNLFLFLSLRNFSLYTFILR
jgi:hypothetical protein